MKGAEVLIEPLARGGAAAALMVDGRLQDLVIDPAPDDPIPAPGAIYRAVLGRPMKGLGGAMVDLGAGRTGFLRDPRGLGAGTALLVQIAAAAEPGKAPPVTPRPLIKRRTAILTPGAPGRNFARSTPEAERRTLARIVDSAMDGQPAELGLILRTAAAFAEVEEIRADIAALLHDWDSIAAAGPGPGLVLPAPDAAAFARSEWTEVPLERVVAEAGAFAQADLWEAIAALRRPQVALPGGAHMAVEPTRALVAVDVNTGPDLSPAAGLKASVNAARELPRQLRLRGLGGQIAIDFAPLSKRQRSQIEGTLKAALAADGIETTLAGWSPLGHLELLRKRARRPLAELWPG